MIITCRDAISLLGKWRDEHTLLRCVAVVGSLGFGFDGWVSAVSEESVTVSRADGRANLMLGFMDNLGFEYMEPRDFRCQNECLVMKKWWLA